MLFGALVGLGAQEAELDMPGLGLLHVQRSAVRRILHWREGADRIYVGPNGLSEWDAPSPDGAWRQEAGQLVSAQNEASLFGDFDIPAQTCIEFELSWTSKPDFTLAFGAGRAGDEQAFRLEVWDRDLVLLGETKEQADLAPLQPITDGAGRCHFLLYLDQRSKRAFAFAEDGKLLADLKVSDANSQSKPGLRLVNHRGNVRLEQLRITPWDGEPPREVQAGKSRLRRFDGATVNGEIKGFDAAAKEFLIAQDGRETRIPADAVESVVLSPLVGPPPCDIRLLLRDGSRLSANLRKVENGRLSLSCPGIAEPLGVGLSELRSLIVLEDQKAPSEPSGRRGRLESDGLKVHGCLVEGREQPEASCLVWHPLGSATASPLKHGVSGRIVYRESSPLQSPSQPYATAGVAQPQVVAAPAPAGGGLIGALGGVVRVMAGRQPAPVSSPPARWFGPALYLRTGDTIPCEVKRIDQRGVTFHSSMFDATSVTHDKIKAVELENRSQATKIDVAKRDRLLTLPRMEKDDPPTHLIRSTDGDYLRGRLIELDDKTLTVEVRLETRRLPRDHIARIIWLEESGEKGKSHPANDTAAGAKPPAATRVQVLRGDGIRLTFLPEKLAGTTLQGTSDVLGACRIEMAEMDQVLIGGAIERTAQTLPYQRWKLQPAVEPKFALGGGGAGMESELVGKPAPDFEIETLDGQPFRLSAHRGTVVVLDFWATWCGPCVQTLPQVVRAVGKYQDHSVILLAVNLHESPEAIKAMLERLELETTVALDRSGVVAEKYAAVAIPQTVIIDGNGKVARLFIGGGPQYADQLREALEAAVTTAAGQGTPE